VKNKNDKLYKKLRKFDKDLLKVNITKNVYEKDILNSDKLAKINIQEFKISNDKDFLKNKFISDQKFNFYLDNLKNLIEKNLNQTNYKNKKVSEIIVNLDSRKFN
jgi:hypothetical protein